MLLSCRLTFFDYHLKQKFKLTFILISVHPYSASSDAAVVFFIVNHCVEELATEARILAGFLKLLVYLIQLSWRTEKRRCCAFDIIILFLRTCWSSTESSDHFNNRCPVCQEQPKILNQTIHSINTLLRGIY